MTQNARRHRHQYVANKRATLAASALASTIALVSAGAVAASPPYHPKVDPTAFSTTIDNPYFPLVPGAIYHYTEVANDGVNQDVQTVTHDIKTIMGVPCVVVHDMLSRKGKVTEDTYDWYSQDKDGNVWYFGEDTKEFKSNGSVTTEGSWEAGVGGALPGIIMKGHPVVGEEYRVEYLKDKAEDMGKVAALKDPVSVPYGSFTDVIRTDEWSNLEAGLEHKWYAKGVGVVRETSELGEPTTLDSFTHP